MEAAIAALELKLNKSFLLVTQEIDSMKEPLVDVFQDFEKQRASLMMELERT